MTQNCHKITLFYIQIHAVHSPKRFFHLSVFAVTLVLVGQFYCFNDIHVSSWLRTHLNRFRVRES